MTREGLIVLYDFTDDSGDMIKDRSGVGDPLDLRIVKAASVQVGKGFIRVTGATVIKSDKAATKVIDAVRKTGEVSVEAWIQTSGIKQTGPARMVTLSANSNERNFTLGQDGDHFEARLRTSKTTTNGMPALVSPSKSLTAGLTHVIYTRDRAGKAYLYINGQQRAAATVAGDPSNWDKSYRLALGNELSDDRPWLGTYFRVAIFDRALSAKDVERHFKIGAGEGASAVGVAKREPSQATTAEAKHFDEHIAPLLARHCLECHGWKSTKGQLDLSHRDKALAGGKTGKAIVPGKSADSLLWKAVASDEMPDGRSPLAKHEKELLRQWIEGGAAWSSASIDRNAYQPARDANANWVRRLTVWEYIRTVREAVGVDVEADARKILPRDLRADGFSNTAYNLNVDLGHVEAYARLAEVIVKRMDVPAFAAGFTRSKELNDTNMRELIAGMGKWLLRGPLDKNEVDGFLRVSSAVEKEGGDFNEAARYLIESMLQSPRFIYRMEKQRGDGKSRRVDAYELASRLSYTIWGSPPDRELMHAADTGELADRVRIEQQVRRMLGDDRAIERSLQFASEWLNLGRLDNLRPGKERFAKWKDQLAADMREETLAYFKEIVWTQKRAMADLFNAQLTIATPALAEHYGLKPGGSNGASRYDLSAVPGRGGLLTQGSVLTIGGDDASMVTRGLFVLHDLLRGHVNDPPPGLDTTPVPSKPGLSQRKIAEGRVANASCGGCHSKFEPLAFGLERFDGVGAYREIDEHGNKLREDGEIHFPGDDKPIRFQSSRQLMDLLAGSDRVRETITWKVTQWALGRPLTETDKPHMTMIHKASQAGGGTYASLITAIVMSDLVQMTTTETNP
ncbi:MAG: DUF1592 domain-containing protein [Phycisphaeraceae bacterium]